MVGRLLLFVMTTVAALGGEEVYIALGEFTTFGRATMMPRDGDDQMRFRATGRVRRVFDRFRVVLWLWAAVRDVCKDKIVSLA